MAIQKLIFVDTNIWLDFYRARTEAGLALLKHLEAVSKKLIVHYQLEMEYKRNRQAVIVEGMQELKPPTQILRPGMFSDAKAAKALQNDIEAATKRVKALKVKLGKAFAYPVKHDPVYQACQRLFHAKTNLVLTRDDPFRHVIRRRAFRRFIHGCPPRKKGDTSIGDALNWEWMIECALRNDAELVIVSRDADYGVNFDGKTYINDHLKHEFAERVSRRRKVLLYTKLSEALKHFEIRVTKAEAKEEEEMVKSAPASPQTDALAKQKTIDDLLREWRGFISSLEIPK